ncbi:hypothetical protein A9K55_007918 [Cordyceps militaris]|uniref:Uncharacterized protein n=1 Tax=Cordyceps militaris TaxID=73501 RepID=A0A2H4SFK7_CORMI|nr:hypothetical protein A9K55_007918 [Cordyceps militaris]
MSSNQTFVTSKFSSDPPSDTSTETQQRRGSKSPAPTGEPDASTFLPSQMREHLGPPEVTHDYPDDSTHRRHSSVSAQQAHFMR